LQKVPERERAALLMAAVEGLPHEQIAAALGCSVAAIKVRIHRARLRLRRLMTAQRSAVL
jgi:RNA polymerase sigma-70 factor (ECF subfamily)